MSFFIFVLSYIFNHLVCNNMINVYECGYQIAKGTSMAQFVLVVQ